MFLASKVNVVRYAATFLIASSTMTLGPMSNAQISANVVSDTARSSAIGLNVSAPSASIRSYFELVHANTSGQRL